MKKEALLISTVAGDAATVARQYALGLELAEFCTAYNLDDAFAQTDRAVREKTAGLACRVLHGPFNELFPCAIDPRARELARLRYRQAVAAARGYGIKIGYGLTKYRIVIRDRSNGSKEIPLVAGNMEIRRDQGYRRCERGNLRFLVFTSEFRCSKNRPGIHPI